MATTPKSKLKSTPETKKKPAGKSSVKTSEPKSAGVKKSTTAEKKKQWALTGELTITSEPKPPIKSEASSFSTFNLTMDQAGNLFSSTSIEVNLNGRHQIIVMSSHQVKILLNALGVVDHAKV